MQRRRLGQLEVSAVGLGCGTMTPFYGEPDRAAGIATIRRAREIGVDFLDTVGLEPPEALLAGFAHIFRPSVREARVAEQPEIAKLAAMT